MPGFCIRVRPVLLAAVLAGGWLAGCDDSGNIETIYLSAADDSACDTLRIDVDLDAASGPGTPPACVLTRHAQDAGCSAEIEVEGGRIGAVVKHCTALDGEPILACAFGGDAPEPADVEEATTTVCACSCTGGCSAEAQVCAAADDRPCGSDAAAQRRRSRAAAATQRGSAAGTEETTTCSVTFGMTSSELAGAVQLRIEPGTEQLRFVGLGTDVRCESLVPSALTSFYAPTSGKLNAGLVTAEGMQGPIALLRCRVRALGQAEPAVFENFTIDRIDATGPLLEPISPTFGVVDVDCSPPEQTVTTCRSRFSMTSNDVAGALQIQVISTDPDVSFVGKASAVECSSLVPSVISAFNSASRSSVVAGFVAVSGLPGPVDLFDCAVRAVGERDAQDFDVFDIELQDASDTSFDPITPTIEHTGTTGCEVSVEPLPTSTSTTTSSSTTTPSSSTTTQTSSTTTHQTPTSSVTSTSTSMPPGNTGTVRVSMISPAPIVAGTFEVTPGDGRILGCTALDDGALILQQGNSVTICLYDENGSDTGTHALADCLVESEPPALPPVVEVKRALGTDLRPVPGVVGQVTDLP